MTDKPQTTTWQPIETAPKDGRFILGYRDSWLPKCAIGYFEGDRFYCSVDDTPHHKTPTHWMELPECPKQ